MKIKRLLSICILLNLLLYSCGAQEQPGKTTSTTGNEVSGENWWDTISPSLLRYDEYSGVFSANFSSMQDIGTDLVYFDQTGIYRYNFLRKKVLTVLKRENIASIYADGKVIYFSQGYDSDHPSEEKNIFVLLLEGGMEPVTFVGGEQMEEVLDGESYTALWDLRIENNYLIFKDSGVDYLACSLATQKVFRLAENCGTLVVIGGMVYHDGRHTESIFRRPLREDAKTEVLFGNGNDGDDKLPSDEPWYKSVYAAGNHLFIQQNNPIELFEYKKDGGRKVIATGDFSDLFSAYGKLYYNDKQGRLLCYDPATEKTNVACDDPLYLNSTHEYAVIRDRVFFWKSSSTGYNMDRIPEDFISLALKR
jgi:hypothetical protein